MRVAITENPLFRHGHVEQTLAAIGIPATMRDEQGRIVCMMDGQQYQQFALRGGGHAAEVLDQQPAAAAVATLDASEHFLMHATPGEPIGVRLLREQMLRDRANNLGQGDTGAAGAAEQSAAAGTPAELPPTMAQLAPVLPPPPVPRLADVIRAELETLPQYFTAADIATQLRDAADVIAQAREAALEEGAVPAPRTIARIQLKPVPAPAAGPARIQLRKPQ